MEEYLSSMEKEMVISQFEEDMAAKEEKSDDKEGLYLSQIEGHNNEIDRLNKELVIARIALKLYTANPMPCNPQFEYEKEEEFVKAVAPFNIKALNDKIELIEKPLHSSKIQIDLLKSRLSSLRVE